jgi:tight adherence protein B
MRALDVNTMSLLIAGGFVLTFMALYGVFGGFFAERRLRDRMEDVEGRARSGPRTLQMATLRRVEKQGRLPTLDKLLWRFFPNASSVRSKLQATGTNMTLGDYAFASLSLAIGVAFVLFLVFDMSPGPALAGASMVGFGLPNVWVGWRAKKRGQKFNLLFPEAVDLIVRALRAGLPVQEAIGNVARDIKEPIGSLVRRVQQDVQLGMPIEAALWRAA